MAMEAALLVVMIVGVLVAVLVVVATVLVKKRPHTVGAMVGMPKTTKHQSAEEDVQRRPSQCEKRMSDRKSRREAPPLRC